LKPGFENPPGFGPLLNPDFEKPPVLGFEGPDDDHESGRGPELGLAPKLGRELLPPGALGRREPSESKPGFWNLGPPKLGFPELDLPASGLP
jgi:hypothetical protein